MRLIFVLPLLLLTALPASSPAWAQESLHNLPIPRWASLASPEANLRTGPGKRYPIDWVLKKKHLPVEIIQEFEHWRRVREPDGADGWIHKSMLAGTRYALLQKDDTLYAQPRKDSRVVALLKKGVLARISECRKEWCRLQIEQFDGWIAKKSTGKNVWGVYRDETFGD